MIIPKEHLEGGGNFLIYEGDQYTFFALPRIKSREVMTMYLTLEHLLLIGSLVVSVLSYIDNHNKKR